MGCIPSKQGAVDVSEEKEAPTSKYQKPRWKSDEALTAAQLKVQASPALPSAACDPYA